MSHEEPTPPVPDTAPAAVPVPEAVPVPVPETSPTPVARPAGRARVLRIVGAAVLALAVVGGVGYTAVAVDGADRDAGAPDWEFPEGKGDGHKAPAASGLAALLVPYGSDSTTGFGRGPDLGEYGADAELSGARATALRKEVLRDLPRSQRRQLERQIDKQHIKGMAMRSYLDRTWDSAATVSITLVRMDRSSVRAAAAGQDQLFDALGDVLRAGPRIKGHKDARCYRPPKDTGDDLDMMYCYAPQGDVLVTATVDGVAPLKAEGATQLLKDQLDRIAEPGEAV
ncbi:MULTISPECIES: hypothetical protein [unclassified Streptomyces]|uniref:hypothetical protein n=1 Tax=unclassified Streptomyces TaxID=2593676 RepID=UPI0004C15CBC|nr:MULTISPECIES: hypothetical protein [unclassified Streptomyces]